MPVNRTRYAAVAWWAAAQSFEWPGTKQTQPRQRAMAAVAELVDAALEQKLARVLEKGDEPGESLHQRPDVVRELNDLFTLRKHLLAHST